MKYSHYLRLERAIATSDRGGILERWRYGTRLRSDPRMVTPNGNLRHGKLAQLIADAKADGIVISDREIQRRLQCARAYRSEAEIRLAADGFKGWADLYSAGFPAVQVPLDADTAEFDPRDDGERRQDIAKEIERAAQEQGGQLALFFDHFPADRFGRLATLADLRKYEVECAERTERHQEADRRRAAYLARLLNAVGGDESKTWAEANEALHGNGGAA
jgi:hypothetical protein